MTAPYENAEFIELGTIMPPEKFLLDFYVDDAYSKSYFVKSEEVLYLLQHCRNPQITKFD